MYQLPPLKERKKPKAPYRKPDAVKDLERMADADAAARHPSIAPEHLAPRKFRDNTANGLTACIVAYSKLLGFFASRLNTTGVYDAKLKRYRHSTQRRGLPDVYITATGGRSLFVEVKVGRDKMSHHQEAVRDEQRRCGGLFFTARNFTEFKEWIDNL